MTMSTDPDEIRAQIEATRAGLSQDVNELGDKVNPANIVQRQRDKVVDTVKGSVRGVKDHIMGSADEVKSSTGTAVSRCRTLLPARPGRSSRRPRTTGWRRV